MSAAIDFDLELGNAVAIATPLREAIDKLAFLPSETSDVIAAAALAHIEARHPRAREELRRMMPDADDEPASAWVVDATTCTRGCASQRIAREIDAATGGVAIRDGGQA